MKIVFLNDLIYAYATAAPSAIGGAERQQWLLARALKSAGWDVAVGVRNLPFKKRLLIEGIEFVGIGQKQFLWAWYCFIRSERPDWCYWRCASHLVGPLFAIARMVGAKTIFAASFDRDVNVRRALFWRPRWWPLYALGLLWANRIFLQNERQLLGLPVILRPKASIVPSIAIETNSSIRHSHRTKYVAWVAMLREPKRPDLLVEIASGSPGIRFIVCGGATTFTAAPGFGEKIADKLRALPNVDYRGQVDPDEASGVIANAAILLSTAEEEGFPNTFLQAWACGTPVVSLTVDPDRIVEQHGLGRISPTVQQAINDIRVLLDSEEERESISGRAREYVQKYNTAPVVVKQFERSTLGEYKLAVQPKTSQTIEHQSSS